MNDDNRAFYDEHYGNATGWTVLEFPVTIIVPTTDPDDWLELIGSTLTDAGWDIRVEKLSVDAIKAEAWDEGHDAGRMLERKGDPAYRNPYRRDSSLCPPLPPGDEESCTHTPVCPTE